MSKNKSDKGSVNKGDDNKGSGEKIGIYIFRKDLRIKDNRGLIKFNEIVSTIIPIFIFDPNQAVRNNKNKDYFSYPALQFLCESVIELRDDINNATGKLHIFKGHPWKVVESIIEELKKKKKQFCFGMNEDYTEYSLYRDNLIIDVCNNNDIDIYTNNDDYTLISADYLLRDKENSLPLTVFLFLNRHDFIIIKIFKIKVMSICSIDYLFHNCIIF
jgi:deoxyribodipyrimidine photo-lyase